MGDATTVGDLLVRIGGNTDALVDAPSAPGNRSRIWTPPAGA